MAAVTFFEAFGTAWAEDGNIHGWEIDQYKQGWSTIGDQKPSVEQFNNTHQLIDQKANYLWSQLKTAADDRGVGTSANKQDTLKELLDSLKSELLETQYPVGKIEIMTVETSPAQRGLPGVWQKLSKGFLYAHGSPKAGALGSQGGATDVTLTTAQMPAHSHSASASSSGSHNHTGTANAAGQHTHMYQDDYHIETYSYMNPPYYGSKRQLSGGYLGADGSDSNNDGMLYNNKTTGSAGLHMHSLSIDSGGTHNHAITVGNAGSGASHENMPPYITVMMWERVS